MKKNQSGVIQCDYCGKPAKYNLQEVYNLSAINKNGKYELVNNWQGGYSENFCEECAYENGIIHFNKKEYEKNN